MSTERITAILVDDEKDGQEILQQLLDRYFPEVEILGIASGVEEACEMIGRRTPDLVFLDIHMPGKDGFELLRQYVKVPFEVIFVTGFDQYAINAIRFSALDYLSKPVEINLLSDAVKKAQKRISEKKGNRQQIINLLHNLDATPDLQKIAVHHAEKVHLLNVSEIESIEADGRYSKLITGDVREFYTARCVKDFEEYLYENPHFVRISKSCIVNVMYIRSYQKGEPCILEMNSGRSFEISRRRKQEVLALLGSD